MKKTENFYRRDPMAALGGMIGLSLEERGVYNVVIDLLYSTWRPITDDRQFVAGWCGCAVQKLNPIINRLIEKQKLIRFEEDGIWYLSDAKFETERTAVKGKKTTANSAPDEARSQGEVGRPKAEAEEKSAGVEENCLVLATESEDKQSVTPIDKRREEKIREEPPSPLKGGRPSVIKITKADVEAIWAITPKVSRERSGKKDLERALLGAAARGHASEAVLRGIEAYFRSEQATKNGGEFAKGVHRVVEGDRWQSFTPEPVTLFTPQPQSAEDLWRSRVRKFKTGSGYWDDIEWGPRPGRDGCRVPPAIIAEFRSTDVSERVA